MNARVLLYTQCYDIVFCSIPKTYRALWMAKISEKTITVNMFNWIWVDKAWDRVGSIAANCLWTVNVLLVFRQTAANCRPELRSLVFRLICPSSCISVFVHSECKSTEIYCMFTWNIIMWSHVDVRWIQLNFVIYSWQSSREREKKTWVYCHFVTLNVKYIRFSRNTSFTWSIRIKLWYVTVSLRMTPEMGEK